MRHRSLHRKQELSFEKVWKMFQETDKKFQETAKEIQETAKEIQETKKMMEETFKRIDDLKVLIEKNSSTVDWHSKRLENHHKKLVDIEDNFGAIVEGLIEGAVAKVFQERGIKIEKTIQNAKPYEENQVVDGKSLNYEFDIIGIAKKDIVVIEAKTTLRTQDITHFLKKLEFFKTLFPEFSNKRVYGAMAFIRTRKDITKHAYRAGLFLIKAANENAEILNDKKFKPKVF